MPPKPFFKTPATAYQKMYAGKASKPRFSAILEVYSGLTGGKKFKDIYGKSPALQSLTSRLARKLGIRPPDEKGRRHAEIATLNLPPGYREKIQQLRGVEGLTQEEAAARLVVDPQTLRAWEHEIFGEQKIRQMAMQKQRLAKRGPKTALIEYLLWEKDGAGKFKFPAKTIESLTGVSRTTIAAINQRAGKIRSEEEIIHLSRTARGFKPEDWASLESDAKYSANLFNTGRVARIGKPRV